MTIITFPSSPGIASIEWTAPASAQVNRSMWTGRRRVTKLPDAGYWKARVSFVAAVSEADFLGLRAFLAAIEGPANSFRLVAVEGAQNSQTAVKVNGGSQTGLSLGTDGWIGSGTALKKGQLITVGDQLIPVAADCTISAGAATISLGRRLRASPADNADVEVRLPWALMALAGDDAGWSVSPGQVYGVAIDCVEDIS